MDLAVDVYLDGKPSGGWIAPDHEPQAKKVSEKIEGSRCGNKLHRFVFSNPKIIGAPQKV